MTLIDLLKMVDHEIQWLGYYALERTKKDLCINSNLYETLKDIGYSKVTTNLKTRCSFTTLKSTNVVTENTEIESIERVGVGMSHLEFHYTPLEVFWIMFPEERSGVIERLNPSGKKWEPFILNRIKNKNDD